MNSQCENCIPDSTCISNVGLPEICPAVIADAYVGVYYSQQITFYIPEEVPNPIGIGDSLLPLNEVIISQVNGLPSGLDFTLYNNDSTFSPGIGENFGCATICGIPDTSGNFVIEIVVNGTVIFFGGEIGIPEQIFTTDFLVLEQLLGCTDSLSCNYNPSANFSDGSCGSILGAVCDDSLSSTINDVINADCICVGEVVVFGCTDSLACNFLDLANIDDGSCDVLFGLLCDDGLANTMNDAINSDCVCEGEIIIEGCMTQGACNFDVTANVDDGTCGAELGSPCNDFDSLTINDSVDSNCDCVGALGVSGCTDIFSCNFNSSATIDDGSCLGFFGSPCDDQDSNTIDDMVTSDCICLGAPMVGGCMNQSACNYMPDANVDDGSCADMLNTPCDDNYVETVNDVIVVGCECIGTLVILGCTDFFACNFDPMANTDDGSCLTIGSQCDDGDESTFNDFVGPNCECIGIPDMVGCMDPLACNYNPLATSDDGSCGLLLGSPCDDNNIETEGDIIIIGCICVGNPLSVSDVNSHSIKIFPIPANDVLTIHAMVPGNLQFWIMNLYGGIVAHGVGSANIDVKTWADGIYIININIEGKAYSEKFEIRRN